MMKLMYLNYASEFSVIPSIDQNLSCYNNLPFTSHSYILSCSQHNHNPPGLSHLLQQQITYHILRVSSCGLQVKFAFSIRYQIRIQNL